MGLSTAKILTIGICFFFISALFEIRLILFLLVPGTGLGKAEQGRLEPVGVSNQRGRRGLGHIIEVSYGSCSTTILS